MSQFRQVIVSDMRKVASEPFFWMILLAPFLLGLVLRDALPYLAGEFQNFDLASYYPVIMALAILTPSLYYGIVLALQLLEEKDGNVLIAVAVTPLQLHTYLSARVLVYMLVSIPIMVWVHQIIGVLEVEFTKLSLIAVVSSLNTPLLVMMLAAFARNQLEGFVIGKGLGFVILFPLAMFFVPSYWHLFCGILPTYWPIIAYFTATSLKRNIDKPRSLAKSVTVG